MSGAWWNRPKPKRVRKGPKRLDVVDGPKPNAIPLAGNDIRLYRPGRKILYEVADGKSLRQAVVLRKLGDGMTFELRDVVSRAIVTVRWGVFKEIREAAPCGS